MSRGSNGELVDFFRMEKETSSAAAAAAHVKPKSLITKKLFERRKSFRDIQGVISKMNPEVVKAVIGSGKPPMFTMSSFSDIPSTPTPTPTPTQREHQTFPITPLYTPTTYRPLADSENGDETAQLTVFYNGTVSVFDGVPRNKAEYILRFAEAESFKTVHSVKKVGIDSSEFVRNFEADLPLARRRSLERFLEKRKERLIMASPYANGSLKGGGLEEYYPRTHLYL